MLFQRALLLGALIMAACTPVAAEQAVAVPAPSVDPADTRTSAHAMLAGGCFWGVEGVFSHVAGVTRVESGFHGGASNSANYDDVSSGTNQHAEVVRITYDPRRVSYGSLLRIFFSVVAVRTASLAILRLAMPTSPPLKKPAAAALPLPDFPDAGAEP